MNKAILKKLIVGLLNEWSIFLTEINIPKSKPICIGLKPIAVNAFFGKND